MSVLGVDQLFYSVKQYRNETVTQSFQLPSLPESFPDSHKL